MISAAKSITGRYPNLGPRLLLDAGIPVVDDVGKEVLSRVTEAPPSGSTSIILYNGSDQVIAKGVLLTSRPGQGAR